MQTLPLAFSSFLDSELINYSSGWPFRVLGSCFCFSRFSSSHTLIGWILPSSVGKCLSNHPVVIELSTSDVWLSAHAGIHTYIHTCMRVCIHACVYACMHRMYVKHLVHVWWGLFVHGDHDLHGITSSRQMVYCRGMDSCKASWVILIWFLPVIYFNCHVIVYWWDIFNQ